MSNPQAIASHVLRHLCALKRSYGSPEEGSVLPFLLGLFPGLPAWVDGAGNLHVDGRTNATHRTLFVGHTDTVHREGGINEFREDCIGLHGVGAPLGADDAAGVAILAAMVGVVPAYYIFTRGEECGGIGSVYLAEHHTPLLREFDRAIAFDRKGTGDVITHQMHGRCASDEFAWALADRLNDAGLMYCPSDRGVYTDTAEFAGLIPECTNISVGYYGEHTKAEWLDVAHHSALLSAVLGIEWDSLPIGDASDAPEGLEWPPCLDTNDEAIRDAVNACLEGRPRDLLGLIAEHVFPEDPRQAARHLDVRSLSEDEVLDACTQYGDWQCILEHLAGEAYIPY